MQIIDLDNLEYIYLLPKRKNNCSYFDGNPINLVAFNILTYISSFLTLGLMFPYSFRLEKEYEINNTYINGRKLFFDGKTSQLIGKYILRLFLSWITLGLYAFKLKINVTRWVYKHTFDVPIQIKNEYEDIIKRLEGKRETRSINFNFYERRKLELEANYNIKGDSNYEATFVSNLIISFIGKLITIFTFGVLYPYALCFDNNFIASKTLIMGKRIKFIGKRKELFKKYIRWYLLIFSTLGLYLFIMPYKIKKWVSENTIFI